MKLPEDAVLAVAAFGLAALILAVAVAATVFGL